VRSAQQTTMFSILLALIETLASTSMTKERFAQRMTKNLQQLPD